MLPYMDEMNFRDSPTKHLSPTVASFPSIQMHYGIVEVWKQKWRRQSRWTKRLKMSTFLMIWPCPMNSQLLKPRLPQLLTVQISIRTSRTVKRSLPVIANILKKPRCTGAWYVDILLIKNLYKLVLSIGFSD